MAIARNKGFTLVELLTVVVILGLLAAIAIGKYQNTRRKAYDAVAVEEIHNLMKMSEAYFADYLIYPDAVEDLLDYTPSPGIVVTRFNRETTDGTSVVHIHLHHKSSSHYFHVEYPVEEIEKRDL